MKENGQLKEAKRFFTLAKSELAQAKKSRDEAKARQAAEKGYLSLLYTIQALFVSRGVKPEKLPQGERGRMVFLVKYGDRETRKKYDQIRHALHIDAFHEGIVIYKNLDERFEELLSFAKIKETTPSPLPLPIGERIRERGKNLSVTYAKLNS